MVTKNVQADSGTTTADKAPAAITDTKAATSLSASKCPQAASQNVHAVVTSTAQALTAAAVSKTPATKSKGLSRISSRGQTPSNPIRLVPLSSISSNEAIKRKKIIQPRTNIVMGQTAISSHPAVRPPRGSVLSPKMFITESGINLLRPAVASRHYAQPSTLQSTLLMSGGGVSVAPSALFAPEGFGVIPTPSAESAAVSSRPNGTKYSLLAANSLNSAVTPSRPAVSASAANRAFDALLPAVDMMSRSAVEPTAAVMRNVGSTAVKNSPTISFSSPEGLSPFAARQVSSTSSQFKGVTISKNVQDAIRCLEENIQEDEEAPAVNAELAYPPAPSAAIYKINHAAGLQDHQLVPIIRSNEQSQLWRNQVQFLGELELRVQTRAPATEPMSNARNPTIIRRSLTCAQTLPAVKQYLPNVPTSRPLSSAQTRPPISRDLLSAQSGAPISRDLPSSQHPDTMSRPIPVFNPYFNNPVQHQNKSKGVVKKRKWTEMKAKGVVKWRSNGVKIKKLRIDVKRLKSYTLPLSGIARKPELKPWKPASKNTQNTKNKPPAPTGSSLVGAPTPLRLSDGPSAGKVKPFQPSAQLRRAQKRPAQDSGSECEDCPGEDMMRMKMALIKKRNHNEI